MVCQVGMKLLQMSEGKMFGEMVHSENIVNVLFLFRSVVCDSTQKGAGSPPHVMKALLPLKWLVNATRPIFAM